jgi:hypothetical protein
MEFLDSNKKRARTTRLFVGYFLIGVLIVLATLIIVDLAQGYGYNPDKGVVQSGLVFIDTQPVSGNVFIDGQLKGRSNIKLELGEGNHNITIKQDKYRDWSKAFSLEGGSVLYFAYPMLFPVNISVGVTNVFSVPPAWVSQSPDRHWLVMQQKSNSPVLTIIDTSQPTNDAASYTIPYGQLISQQGQYGTLTPVEWSSDNRHILMAENLPNGGISYIVVDLQDATQTVNISNKLSILSDQKVTLFNKKYDKYYVHNPTTGELKTADLKSGVSADPVLTGVVAFKSYADNLIVYATYTGAKNNEARIMVLNNQTDKYLLQSLPRNPNNQYLLDLAQFDSNWYYVTAASNDNKVLFYRNPLSRAKAGNTIPIPAQMSLILANPQFVSFSDNTRFVSMQSGKQFVVFDAEQNKVFRYTSPLPITSTQQATWMDGHRMTVVTDNKVQVFEFDGTNSQTLTASRPEFIPYFDRNYKYIFTMMPQADGKIGFETGQLIAK